MCFSGHLRKQVLCWVTVGFRLHTRFRIVRDPGLDDAFVVIAAILSLTGHIGFYGSMFFPL
jgi:hypothetical protein